MPTGLIRRAGGMYSTRRRIPLALVPFFKGKAEVVRALGTNNPTEARRLHALMWVELDRQFDAAREAAAKGPPLPHDISEWEIENAEFWERHYAEEDTPERQARAAEMQAARVRWEAEAAEERAEHRAEKAAVAKAKGAIPLSSVVDKWAGEQKPGHRALTRARKIVEDFEALNGKLAVQAVTKQHVLAYKDALIAGGQSPANANLLLGWVGTILIFARDKLHLIEVNPAANVRLTDKRRDKDKRRAFEEVEITAIFESPVYTDALRPAAGGGEAAYWLPLLALYTGARQTELGQLHPDDIVQEAYRDADDKPKSAWVVRIVENVERGQQVKNEGSERRIPIHADLIALGFIRYGQQAKAAGWSRIFPDIEPNSIGVLMGNWSKWFGRYRRQVCKVAGRDTPFHSFRHTFKHLCRLADISPAVHNEFTGHETGDVADTYGGLSYPLHPLVEGMKRYRVPGLKLPAPPSAFPKAE